MASFVVDFREPDNWTPAVWQFTSCAADATFCGDKFPEEFYVGFENAGPQACYDAWVVWMADNTQALVALDWLLERDWHLNREASDPKFLAMLDA